MCNSHHVLIADDTPLVRWAVRRALNEAGFRVIEAQSRTEVLEALVSCSFQLVILSLELVRDDMEDVARAIASSAGTTALIVLTQDGTLPDALRSQPRVKAIDKPFSITSIVQAAVSLAPLDGGPAGKSISL